MSLSTYRKITILQPYSPPMQFSPAQDNIRRIMGEGVSCGGGGDCSSISMRVVPAILLTGIQGLWKEKEVVYVTVVVLEVVVASFLGYVIKTQRSKAGERGGVFDELS
ncbi:hypothetical protein D5086_030660 [Populus alba]|uniref:Uncharacterized protein n=1 Tax=Populus alba TaxID=43335 RepID=A0ACC4APS9_POPAL